MLIPQNNILRTNKILCLSLLTILLLFTACDSDNKPNTKTTDQDPSEDSAFSDFEGHWDRKGYGELWVIDDTNLSRYNYNSFGCVQGDQTRLADVDNLRELLALTEDKNAMKLFSPASSVQTFQKLPALPDNCSTTKLLMQNDAETNFEFLWHSFNDYYAFFELRNIDWQQAYNTHRSQVTPSTTPEQLVEIIEDMIGDFGDGHVSLTDNDTFEIDASDTKGFELEVYRSDFVDADKDLDDAYDELRTKNDQVLISLLENQQLKTLDDANAIRWGKLPGNVGYLRVDRVHTMGHNPPEESDNLAEIIDQIKKDVDVTDLLMKKVMTDLENTDGMIVDLRFNDGGFDTVSLKIASYFSAVQQVIGTKQVRNKDHQGETLDIVINAAPETAYSKPVYVVTGQSTGSGGEVLSMAFKALPQVTLIGEPTGGDVSDSLTHTLPNGWQLSLSNEFYADKDGAEVESIGIKPDTFMFVYASNDLKYISNTPIDYAMQKLGLQPPMVPDVAEVETIVDTIFPSLKIPGMAVAVVKDNEIVWSKGFGVADIDTERPVTADTPFNIGSISKTFVATAITHGIENDLLNLDESISAMNLPFIVDNPHIEGEDISLRHLVTHTSGIKDSDGYLCSYYSHEDDTSLLNQVSGQNDCPNIVTTDSTLFYQQYFTPGGKYYMDDPYLSGESATPGTTYEYSNVAAALAAYAVEKKLGIDLIDTMQENIFTPLRMTNTAWRHTDLNPDNPKAIQYILNKNDEPIAMPEYSYPTFFDGDLNTSANDLARYMSAIANLGKLDDVSILEEDSVRFMLSPQTNVLTPEDVQGIFWVWSGSYVGHTGGDPGTIAIMEYNMATRSGLVMLLNGDDDSIGKDELNGKLLPLFTSFYRLGLGK